MSHARICSAVAGVPKPNRGEGSAPAAVPLAASESPATSPATQAWARRPLQDLHIRDLAGCVHAPALDRVVVVDRARAPDGTKRAQRRLNVAGFVDDARLQQGGPAVP